ncbi:MAG: CofH family radical SAM protein [Fibrobacteraceae bacterium]|nr:CofH family radical SAM protein [Fibrobacteraceae bacterium]
MRLSEKEALDLFLNMPFDELFQKANAEKEKRHGKNIYWVNNRQINYTNVCILHCSFCAFSKIKKTSENAYDWTIPEIVAKAKAAVDSGAKELHIVGGLHPDHPFEYYIQMLSTLRREFPKTNLKAFTAVEICHFAKLSGRSVENILADLKKAGLDALPGGGAELLGEDIRKRICGKKETGAEWLDVHRAAHKMGIHTNATILFGHIEKPEDRIRHMMLLRDLQDEAPGFFAFIPLVYHPEHTPLGTLVKEKTSEEDILRTIAISRLFLDNFPHIKAYWIQTGIPTAMKAIHAGASDLDGTIMEEKITHAAGATTEEGMSPKRMQELILNEKLVPVERDALYDVVSV